MGLMQSACETYEAMAAKYVGNYDQKEALAPVAHIVTSSNIEVTLTLDGQFMSASAVDKDAPKIIIPATEKSAGRSGKDPIPHPLCDKVKYFLDKDKLDKYLGQLTEWCEACEHPTLKAVLAYVKGGTLINDLMRADLLKREDKGGFKNEDALIRWRVEGAPTPNCWEDWTLFEAFSRYYESVHEADGKALCMLNGKVARMAVQHPKGVVALNGNAKLISSNDRHGFTYRGRFEDDSQALTISYEASQKAHAAIRWLVANQGVTYGGRTFICWNPRGHELPRTDQPLLFRRTEPIVEATDYRDALAKTLKGWQECLPREEGAVIAAFDAATKGRLAVTYYSELLASDLVARMAAWDESCCWWNGLFGVQSPKLARFVNHAFGTARKQKDGTYEVKCDDRVFKQHMQRMIACRVGSAPFPQDIKHALVEKCRNLYLFDDDWKTREELLFTTCAAIRKCGIDRKEEEWDLALEPDKRNRSYQYGRLLAVLEKAEQDTYEKDEKKRLPNAIRLQPMYVRRPQHTFSVVIEMLKQAYYPRLKSGARTRYEKLIGEILSVISECPAENGSGALTDSYLMGYYLQKKELYTKQDKEETEEEAE